MIFQNATRLPNEGPVSVSGLPADPAIGSCLLLRGQKTVTINQRFLKWVGERNKAENCPRS